MDGDLLIAIVGAGGLVCGTVISQVFPRRLTRLQRDGITQDIYQQLTADLKAELDRVKAELLEARQTLRSHLADEEQLRRRIAELEFRVSQLAANEATLSAELRAVQRERDQLLIQLSASTATITALNAQISDLKVQAATLQSGAHVAAS